MGLVDTFEPDVVLKEVDSNNWNKTQQMMVYEMLWRLHLENPEPI